MFSKIQGLGFREPEEGLKKNQGLSFREPEEGFKKKQGLGFREPEEGFFGTVCFEDPLRLQFGVGFGRQS